MDRSSDRLRRITRKFLSKLKPWLIRADGDWPSQHEDFLEAVAFAFFGSFILLIAVSALYTQSTAASAFVIWLAERFLAVSWFTQVLVAMCCPFAMVVCKKYALRTYGAAEVVVGGILVFQDLDRLQASTGGKEWIVLIAAIYGMSRGVQNLTQGFLDQTEKRRKAQIAASENAAPAAVDR